MSMKRLDPTCDANTLMQIKCLQSKTTQELVAAFPKTPAFRTNTLLSRIHHVQWPNTTNINGPIIDGEFIKEEPLKTGPLVPIVAGSSKHNPSGHY